MGVYDFTKMAFYPYAFTRMSVSKTSDNTTSITSGAIVNGHVYSILEEPTGGTPAFSGASDLTKGSTFVATGTTATWGTTDTGELIDITSGKPTEIKFYNKTSVAFKWIYIYNDDDFCVSYSVVDELGNVIQ